MARDEGRFERDDELEDVDADLLTPLEKLNKDLKAASKTLSDREARYLVDTYYQMQEYRKALKNQVLALTKAGEPTDVIEFFAKQFANLEGQVKLALDLYSRSHPRGKWLRSVVGIGPVIAAGFLAAIDLDKVQTVSNVWRFAGLDPTIEWIGKKGAESVVSQVREEFDEKEPSPEALLRVKELTNRSHHAIVKMATDENGPSWQALQKGLAKLYRNPKDYYGKRYVERKMYEIERNDRGDNRELALQKAETVGKSTDAYKWLSGKMDGMPKLPPGQIDARARRWAVKLFISHMVQDFLECEGRTIPKPFAIEHLGHAHLLDKPTFE